MATFPVGPTSIPDPRLDPKVDPSVRETFRQHAHLMRHYFAAVSSYLAQVQREQENAKQKDAREEETQVGAVSLYTQEGPVSLRIANRGNPGDVLYLIDALHAAWGVNGAPAPTDPGTGPDVGSDGPLLDGVHNTDTVPQTPSKGSLVVGKTSPSALWDELPVGTDGFALVADSAQTLGVKWAAVATSEVELLGIYGDGTDGNATFNGVNTFSWATLVGSTYFLTRDVFLADFTISNGVTVDTSGWALFWKGTGTVNAGGILSADGAAGTAGANGAAAGTPAGGTGGAAVLQSTMGTSTSGGNGRNGQTGVGTLGTAGGAAVGEGGDGGTGGAGEVGPFGATGGGTRAGTTTTIRRQRSTTTRLFIVDYFSTYALIQGGTGGSGGSSGGGGGAGIASAAGGGGGAGGRVLGLWGKTVVNNGRISANGGVGGAGGASAGFGGAGGGGGGGGGGFLWLYYDTYSGSGTLTASGGTGGAAGTSGGYGAAAAGGNGAAGVVIKYSRLTGVFT